MPTQSVPADEVTLLEVRRISDLGSYLRALNVTVPGRGSGRTSGMVEVYGVVRLLASRSYALSEFPLRLIKRERPDFMLVLNGEEVGVEHTEAISQNDAKEAALRDQGVGPDTYFAKPTSLDERVKSSKELATEIEADEMSDGWSGESVELGWAEAMARFVEKKTVSAQRPGYTRFARNWLVVYDQWPAPMLNHANAIPRLLARLAASPPWEVFDQIFILDENILIELGVDTARVSCVNHCE